jgi:hypothetical protein
VSPGISLSLHCWRGIGPDREPDLFVWRYRFGLLTVSVERVSLLETVRQLRRTIREALEITGEGR